MERRELQPLADFLNLHPEFTTTERNRFEVSMAPENLDEAPTFSVEKFGSFARHPEVVSNIVETARIYDDAIKYGDDIVTSGHADDRFELIDYSAEQEHRGQSPLQTWLFRDKKFPKSSQI